MERPAVLYYLIFILRESWLITRNKKLGVQVGYAPTCTFMAGGAMPCVYVLDSLASYLDYY